VRLYANGRGDMMVSARQMRERFPTVELQEIILSPLRAAGQEGALDVSVHVSGGGVRGQAEAIRLGIARALLKLNPLFRKALKKEGFLRRDARVKERKKYGLKRARRAPQWQKR
jgi:small subunit ribosomal protein S9